MERRWNSFSMRSIASRSQMRKVRTEGAPAFREAAKTTLLSRAWSFTLTAKASRTSGCSSLPSALLAGSPVLSLKDSASKLAFPRRSSSAGVAAASHMSSCFFLSMSWSRISSACSTSAKATLPSSRVRKSLTLALPALCTARCSCAFSLACCFTSLWSRTRTSGDNSFPSAARLGTPLESMEASSYLRSPRKSSSEGVEAASHFASSCRRCLSTPCFCSDNSSSIAITLLLSLSRKTSLSGSPASSAAFCSLWFLFFCSSTSAWRVSCTSEGSSVPSSHLIGTPSTRCGSKRKSSRKRVKAGTAAVCQRTSLAFDRRSTAS
mmetsp:Transcript_14610/g.31958  ORF Transcript_14610/g.31958 Transcript_14610/m.31958 type:complete len:322 (+) Transcript_14610:1656-2621(+)